jgi:cephalosporin hydroxylase
MKYLDKLPSHKYQWIPLLYSIIYSLKPKKIIEYGTEWGGTAITMGLALKNRCNISLPFRMMHRL